MTDQEWTDWSAYHATLHRFTDADDLSMLECWRESFEARGFSSPDLKLASQRLAEDAPKTWRNEHLEYLLKFVSDLKCEATLAKRLEAENSGKCGICGDKGTIPVPDPRTIIDNRWAQGSTIIVSCNCPRGLQAHNDWFAMLEKMKSDKRRRGKIPAPLLNIVGYEATYPTWRELVKQREKDRDEKLAMHDDRGQMRREPFTVSQVIAKEMPPLPKALPAPKVETDVEVPF